MSWYAIRSLDPQREGETAFVAKSWLEAFRDFHWTGNARRGAYLTGQNRRLGATLKHAYYVEHTAVVNATLGRSRTLVATIGEGMDEVIVGFATAEHHVSSDTTVLHFVYTRSGYRRQGIARALVKQLVAEVGHDNADVVRSHSTPMARLLIDELKKLPCPFVPYPAFSVPTSTREETACPAKSV